MPQASNHRPFSQELADWLRGGGPHTIAGLTNLAREKSFALLFVVLMAFSALPVPTGGITHVFEIITMLLALELLIGRQTVWLPKKWLNRPLGSAMTQKGLPFLIGKVRWLEKYSRPRARGVLSRRDYRRLTGLLVFIFTLASFLAPPFSGLDTIPSMGVVGIGLALILEDIVIYSVAVVIGLVGILVEIGLAAAATNVLSRLI